MITVGVIGYHFVSGEWRQTVIPLVLQVARGESTAACKTLLLAFLFLAQQLCQITDIMDRLHGIYTDRAPGFAAAAAEVMPDVPHHTCLQHAKKNLKENAPGLDGKTVFTIQKYIEYTAFIPNTAVFTSVWSFILEKLRAAGGAPAQLAEYIVRSLLSRTDDDLFTASWRSDYNTVKCGFSTFTSNCIESFQALLKKAFHKRLNKLEITQSIGKLQELVQRWVTSGRFQDVVYLPTTDRLVRKFIRGKGNPVNESEFHDGAPRSPTPPRPQKSRPRLLCLVIHLVVCFFLVFCLFEVCYFVWCLILSFLCHFFRRSKLEDGRALGI